MQSAIDIFAVVIQESIPFAVAFWMGEWIVRSFLTMAFRGRVEL